ncbi:lysophospholipid acyltransferase family protein [Parabacteroides sp. OttesenSCG-928-B22]|nr:lysophospholipid acyltransferase family protein [Parabacteroides sp. OttesenSCG-928-B22]
MGKIVGWVLYQSFYISLYVVGLLPMQLLYKVSSFSSYFMFHVLSYRKRIVTQNLSRSFPEKSEEERKQIAVGFYRCFTDNIVEIVKLFSINPERQAKKVSVTGAEQLVAQLENNKHVIVCMGHCANWEILNILPYRGDINMYAVYKPLRNRAVDRLFLALRSRFGLGLVPSRSIVKHFLSNKNNPSVYFFIADQCPKVPEEKYRLMMLNQQTSMFSGVEKLARSTDAAVMYMHVTRTSRGNYAIDYKLISTQSKQTEETEIIRQYASLLEQNILENPSDWLWSHKRWKR